MPRRQEERIAKTQKMPRTTKGYARSRHNPGRGIMTQVMKPRLVAAAIGAPHPGKLPKPLECTVQRTSVQCRSMPAEKEMTPGAG